VADPEPEHLVRQLMRLAHGQFDMRSAAAVGRLLVDHHDRIGPLSYGLLTGFVVSYVRPFTESKTYGRLEDKWSKFPDDRPNFERHHKRLLELRNQLLAHTDETAYRRVTIDMVKTPPEISEGRSPIDAQGIEAFLEMVEFQEARFGEEARKLAARLHDMGYLPDGELIELSADGEVTILDREAQKFRDSRLEPTAGD
jgi:hypothetical protein